MARFLVLNGPNINILGRRLPEVYGARTLDEINDEVTDRARSLGVEVAFYQSNVEGHLIDCIQENWGKVQGIIVNPGALTHYGLSLRDALADTGLPVVEVHLSNIHARERWRRRSVVASVARAQISGLGWRGYIAALAYLVANDADGAGE